MDFLRAPIPKIGGSPIQEYRQVKKSVLYIPKPITNEFELLLVTQVRKSEVPFWLGHDDLIKMESLCIAAARKSGKSN